MVYNYIIKSQLGTVIIDGKEFVKVEKDASTNSTDVLKDYKRHIKNNLNPVILKRDENTWKEITVLELKKDIQGAKKLPGLRKAFKVKSGWK